jgi:peptidoglycan/xylan/chitin deacetylase (PgdA/CDA1 family)
MDKRTVMPEPGKISALWTGSLPDGVGRNIRAVLESAETGGQPPRVFFRADDIGVADERFSRLMHLFAARRMPLCLAVVPGWLDRPGWKKMREYDPASPLWCWHQHGWNHANHEAEGKKCEFGESRDRAAIHADLRRGRDRLDLLLGDLFLPVFTPPWNRCSRTTLQILAELGFHAVSRYNDAQPPAAGILPDLAVNVDLHTRREQNYQLGWRRLLEELSGAARNGCIGFMLHHQRMNDAAFAFLDILLAELSSADVACCTFRELLGGGPAEPAPCS